MAKLIKVDGTEQEVHPANGKRFALAELQGFVGGSVEMTDLGKGIMWINEDGKGEGLIYNESATDMSIHVLFVGDYIVGDALVLSAEEDRESREGDEDEDIAA